MKIRQRALICVLTGFSVASTTSGFAPFRLKSPLLGRPSLVSSEQPRSCKPIPTGFGGSTVKRGYKLTSVAQSSSLSAEAPSAETGHGDHVIELNRELDVLAERCSSPEEKVIHLASEAEALYNRSQGIRNTISLNIILKAWGHACKVLADNLADRDFDDVNSKPAAVKVYTARDAADHATRLLVEAENEYATWAEKEGNHDYASTSHRQVVPNEDSYNTVIYAWARSGTNEGAHIAERLFRKLMKNDRLQADSYSYNAILNAWSFSRHPEAPERLFKLYSHVRDVCDDEDNNIEIFGGSYNHILKAHVIQVVEAEATEEKVRIAERAHGVFNEMKARYEKTGFTEDRPDVVHYTSLMDAYVKCRTVEGCQVAEGLLEELKQLGADNPESHLLQPNAHTYATLISGLLHSYTPHSAKRSLELLDEMESVWKKQQESGVDFPEDYTCQPSEKTYVLVIASLGGSEDDNKAQLALRLLRRMKDMAKAGEAGVAPSINSYNAVMEVCAKCGRSTDVKVQMEALKISFAVFKAAKLDPDVTLTPLSFIRILRCVGFLMTRGDEQDQVASVLFEEARKAGLVDFEVCKNLGRATTRPVRDKLLKATTNDEGKIDYNNLPNSWKRNCSDRSKRYAS